MTFRPGNGRNLGNQEPQNAGKVAALAGIQQVAGFGLGSCNMCLLGQQTSFGNQDREPTSLSSRSEINK